MTGWVSGEENSAAATFAWPSLRRLTLYLLLILLGCAALAVFAIHIQGDSADIKNTLEHFLLRARDTKWALPLVIGAYIAAGFVMFPVMALNLAVAVVFGVTGIFYGLIGIMANASVFYAIGAALRKWEIVTWNKHPRFVALDRKFGAMGLAGVVALQTIPAPPFTIKNLVAGMSSIGAVTYLAGTLFTAIPGAVARGVLGESLIETILHPQAKSFWMLMAALAGWILLIGGFHLVLKRWQKRAEISP